MHGQLQDGTLSKHWYRMAGNFCGVLIFVIFVTDRQSRKFSPTKMNGYTNMRMHTSAKPKAGWWVWPSAGPCQCSCIKRHGNKNGSGVPWSLLSTSWWRAWLQWPSDYSERPRLTTIVRIYVGLRSAIKCVRLHHHPLGGAAPLEHGIHL